MITINPAVNYLNISQNQSAQKQKPGMITDSFTRKIGFKGEIHVAAEENDLEKIKVLIKENQDVVHERDDAGWTALHCVSRNGFINIVEILIKAGAKVNIQKENERTPLHLAVLNNHIKTAEILLKYGADLDIRDKNEKTPLELAKRWNYGKMVKLLKKAQQEQKEQKEREEREKQKEQKLVKEILKHSIKLEDL